MYGKIIFQEFDLQGVDKVLKYIGYILVLMLSGIVGCAATEPGNIPLDGLNTNSFDIGEITDGEITDDLRHSTCTLRLADNKKEDSYNYIEGAICPTGGEECTYSAIMKLNGNITILKQ
ncbi:adhesin, partial [Salmonella enterica]|nr:adhesin [Salmonella enterica]EDK9360865.1 adhesin [Salmonella enterica]EEI6231490.1 adhesin [Salmonella enterica]